jgi:protein-L-isoaspartate(D-aspartate) O-methyltransferase
LSSTPAKASGQELEMELRELRRVYARQMLTIASASGNERLEEAFACVPREKFLGPAGWRILTPWSPLSYIRERDPALVYQDVVVALDEERGVNNGSPSLHARWLHLVSPREGEKVAHIGAGAGYYSAILSELVGPDGRVTAIEYDAALAERARENLSDRENVDVVHDNGCGWPKEPTDVVYVNFAIPHPAVPWIENLAMGGRLIFPLGVPRTTRVGGQTLNAIAILVTRLSEGCAASAVHPASFVFAEGFAPKRGLEEIRSLQKSLRRGGWDRIKSLIWNRPVDGAKCWHIGSGWALSFDEVTR